MNAFPLLKTGAVLQYPARKHMNFSTQISRFLDGTEQRSPDFGANVQFWDIRLDLLTEEEMQNIHTFHSTQQGRYGSFSFVDPWDGTEYPDCSFAADSLDLQYQETGRGRVSLIVRNNEA